MTLTVAIVGRPNVGKSTLFNRLAGKRLALTDDAPGLTRDWREAEASIGPLSFRAIDTAGLEQAEKGTLASRMTEHSLVALKEADVALLVVDAQAGITPVDKHFAALLRKSGIPVVLAVNKAESERVAGPTIAEAHGLGLGEPIAISAAHGEGLAELYDALAKFEKEDEAVEETDADKPLAIAIIGRPNAGKSTLVNRLLGKERQLTGPEAGITRDAIAIPFTYEDRALTLVDTAGLRRKANIQESLEKLAAADAIKALKFAEVLVLMMDATLALEKQDLQLADLAIQEGRALVLAINKWDLVPKATREPYLEAVQERLEETLAQARGVPVVPIAAEKGEGMRGLMRAIFEQARRWNIKLSTGELNRWLEGALTTHAPPLVKGRRLKIRYMTQTNIRPPTFTLFANVSQLPAAYERYLVNSLREHFELHGTPLRIRVKKGKNPYADNDE